MGSEEGDTVATAVGAAIVRLQDQILSKQHEKKSGELGPR